MTATCRRGDTPTSLLIAVVFGALAIWQFAIPLVRMHQAKSWQPNNCTILSSRIQEGGAGFGETPDTRIDLKYLYRFADSTFHGTRYQFGPAWSLFPWSQTNALKSLDSGEIARCYVNPSNPRESVIRRGMTFEVWLGAVTAVIALVAFSVFLLKR